MGRTGRTGAGTACFNPPTKQQQRSIARGSRDRTWLFFAGNVERPLARCDEAAPSGFVVGQPQQADGMAGWSPLALSRLSVVFRWPLLASLYVFVPVYKPSLCGFALLLLCRVVSSLSLSLSLACSQGQPHRGV